MSRRKGGKRHSRNSKKIKAGAPTLRERALEKKRSDRRFYYRCILALSLFLTSIWIYDRVVYWHILPKYGKETEGVIFAVVTDGEKCRYYYKFKCKGKPQVDHKAIYTETAVFHMDDTVKVLYWERFPSINKIVLDSD